MLANWHGAVLGASLLLLAWRLSRRDVRAAVWRRGLKTGEEPARVASVILLLIAVGAVNAAICGMLSGPFARYQSRLAWLLPIGAGMVMCALPMNLGLVADRALGLWRLALPWGLSRWERMQAWPVIGRFVPSLTGDFFRFCCVGAIGFIVDFGVLKTVVYCGMSPIGGRFVSVLVATTTTFLVNRAWTFSRQAGHHSLLRELSTYFAVQSAGFAANFAVYTGLLTGVPALHGRLLPPMVAGTLAGLVINYLGAKHIVFRRRPRPS
jgi:putative flippase GtrA